VTSLGSLAYGSNERENWKAKQKADIRKENQCFEVSPVLRQKFVEAVNRQSGQKDLVMTAKEMSSEVRGKADSSLPWK
jgi:hypothetical protein